MCQPRKRATGLLAYIEFPDMPEIATGCQPRKRATGLLAQLLELLGQLIDWSVNLASERRAC